MILTVTMNPSIDMSYFQDESKKFQIDEVNRFSNYTKTAGGKGLNVSKVVHQLEAPLLATGLVGGNFGQYIKDYLDEQEIKHDFSEISSETRNSIAILHEGKQTELLESGPEITFSEKAFFLEKFVGLVEEASVLTISGSLPRGLNTDFYAKIIGIAKESNVAVLLDSSGGALKEALKVEIKPTLIKPNIDEITELVGREPSINNIEEFKSILNEEYFKNIEWIIVSLGAEGAFIKHHDKYYHAQVPSIDAVSAVGSGDATIAGLAYSIYNNEDTENIIKTGMTTGVLNTLEENTGYINLDNFDRIYEQIIINPYN